MATESEPERDRRQTRRSIAALALAILAVVFAVVNLNDVKVDWIVGSGKAPLIVVIAVSLLAGAFIGLLAERMQERQAQPLSAAGGAMELSRHDALELLNEWVDSESLRRHCLAVEAAMRAAARDRGADEGLWGATGLLHDLDYERYPDLETGHPRMAIAELERRGYPPALIRAVASHADFMGVSRDSELELTLAAVDELCGFILACAYVRPQGIHGLTPKSVRKKLKQPSFAAAVDRAELEHTVAALGVDFDEHLRLVIAALEPHAAELGVDGTPG